MATKKKYCVMCGNVYTETNRGCPVCASGGYLVGGALFGSRRLPRGASIKGSASSREFRVNGVRRRSTSFPPADTSSAKEVIRRVITTRRKRVKTAPTRAPSPKRRLHAYNEFLSVVYRKPIRFSTLLMTKGIRSEDISKWKQDFNWIHRFMSSFQLLLEEEIRAVLKGANPVIIRWSYGLDGETKLNVKLISKRLSISNQDVVKQKLNILNFLRSNEGHQTIDRTLNSIVTKLNLEG